MIMSLLKNNFFLYHIIPVIIISQRNYSNFVNGLFDLLLHWLGNKGGENLYDQDKQFHIYFGHVQLMH